MNIDFSAEELATMADSLFAYRKNIYREIAAAAAECSKFLTDENRDKFYKLIQQEAHASVLHEKISNSENER